MVVTEITTLAQLETCLADAGEKLVVVDFFADWCGPCKKIGPVLKDISDTQDIVALKVNVDEVTELADRYEVSALPTIILFKKNEKIDVMVGANEEKLRGLIQANITQTQTK